MRFLITNYEGVLMSRGNNKTEAELQKDIQDEFKKLIDFFANFFAEFDDGRADHVHEVATFLYLQIHYWNFDDAKISEDTLKVLEGHFFSLLDLYHSTFFAKIVGSNRKILEKLRTKMDGDATIQAFKELVKDSRKKDFKKNITKFKPQSVAVTTSTAVVEFDEKRVVYKIENDYMIKEKGERYCTTVSVRDLSPADIECAKHAKTPMIAESKKHGQTLYEVDGGGYLIRGENGTTAAMETFTSTLERIFNMKDPSGSSASNSNAQAYKKYEWLLYVLKDITKSCQPKQPTPSATKKQAMDAPSTQSTVLDPLWEEATAVYKIDENVYIIVGGKSGFRKAALMDLYDSSAADRDYYSGLANDVKKIFKPNAGDDRIYQVEGGYLIRTGSEIDLAFKLSSEQMKKFNVVDYSVSSARQSSENFYPNNSNDNANIGGARSAQTTVATSGFGGGLFASGVGPGTETAQKIKEIEEIKCRISQLSARIRNNIRDCDSSQEQILQLCDELKKMKSEQLSPESNLFVVEALHINGKDEDANANAQHKLMTQIGTLRRHHDERVQVIKTFYEVYSNLTVQLNKLEVLEHQDVTPTLSLDVFFERVRSEKRDVLSSQASNQAAGLGLFTPADGSSSGSKSHTPDFQ